jgi:hypothetical protein
MAGAYYLRHMAMTFDEVLALDYSIAGRAITANNQLSLQWYCYWLVAAEGFTLDCSLNAPAEETQWRDSVTQ